MNKFKFTITAIIFFTAISTFTSGCSSSESWSTKPVPSVPGMDVKDTVNADSDVSKAVIAIPAQPKKK